MSEGNDSVSSWRMRNVICEWSLDKPNVLNRLVARGSEPMPTIHIFGITPQGEKACAHVHGVLPYLMLRVGADFCPQIETLMKDRLNSILHREIMKSRERPDRTVQQYVHSIQPLMRRSMYGVHRDVEPFVKVFLTNPAYISKLFTGLGRECERNSIFQPFEAHIKYVLQFFIDNSIFGMDEIHFRTVKYRVTSSRDPHEIVSGSLTVDDVINSENLLSPLEPETNCAVEIDVTADAIMNAEMQTKNVFSSNPGLEYIWREEAERCKLQNRKLEDTFNNYTLGPESPEAADLNETLAAWDEDVNPPLVETDVFENTGGGDEATNVPCGEEEEEELRELVAMTQPVFSTQPENIDEAVPQEGMENVADEKDDAMDVDMDADMKAVTDSIASDTKEPSCEWLSLSHRLPLRLRGKGRSEEFSQSSDVTIVSSDISYHQVDVIVGASICVFTDVCRTLTPICHEFITSIHIDMCNEPCVRWAEDELAIMNRIVDIVKMYDPELLVGYDITRLSWGFLQNRATAIGFTNLHAKLSRYYNRSSEYEVARGEGIAAPSGRILQAIWKVVRSDLQLRSYDRGIACLEILKRRFSMLDDAAVSVDLLSSSQYKRRTAIMYMQRLSFLNVELLSEMDWFHRNIEMARVYGIQLHEVWTRGSQLRVESMLLRLAHSQGFLAPSVTPHQRTRMCAPEQLQLILEPESKVYFDPVIVLDFQSLYPSMVIAYNYCFSTLFGKVGFLEQSVEKAENCMELGAIQYNIPVDDFVSTVADRKVHSSPLGSAFVTKANRDGLLPTMLREVLGARIMIKTAMKFTKSKRLRRILEARQMALKLVANVTYGYTSANYSGRMPCVEVADAILGKGRETLERAIALVQEGSYAGSKVIYGDTDSMFVLVPGATLEEAFAIGRRIAADVTAANPAPVVLKLEKVYMGCALETKKRYAGWMFESEKDPGELQSKGIETIRRDTCPIVAKILSRCLELLFTRRFSAMSMYLDSKLSRLQQLPYTDFVFCKEYRGDYADNAPVPQKKIAMLRASRCAAHVPLRGERMPYLVVQGHPLDTVISCVKSLEEFVNNPHLKIHSAYYVHSHILAALRRVTDLVPMKIEWAPDRTKHCFTPDCRTLGRRPWCVSCVSSASAFTTASLAMARDSRLRHLLRQACQQCIHAKQVNMQQCTNHHCVVKQVWNGLQRAEIWSVICEHDFSGADKKLKWTF